MPVSPWMTPGPDFPYELVAIYHTENNYNESSEDPGDNQHLILVYKESNNDHGFYLSYKIQEYDYDGAAPPQTLQGYYKIHQIRYKRVVVDNDEGEYEEQFTMIEFKTVDNPAIINHFSLVYREYDDEDEESEYFAMQRINGETQSIVIDSDVYNYFSMALLENMPGANVHLPPAPVPHIPAPPAPVAPVADPLPGTPRVLGSDLVPGEHYHVWTRESAEFKHEGHGKFVRRQNGGMDTLFEPFTIPSGVVLESQVFEIANSYFYKLTNIKGGKRKSRKSRKATKKSRKGRKSRRNMRR